MNYLVKFIGLPTAPKLRSIYGPTRDWLSGERHPEIADAVRYGQHAMAATGMQGFEVYSTDNVRSEPVYVHAVDFAVA